MNGKQLVFTFMSATVVAVVVFLCGVMVGRGVEPSRPSGGFDVVADTLPDPTTPDPTAPISTASPLDVPATGPDGAPAPSKEQLRYPGLLEGDDPTAERLEAPRASATTGAGSGSTALPAPPRESAPTSTSGKPNALSVTAVKPAASPVPAAKTATQTVTPPSTKPAAPRAAATSTPAASAQKPTGAGYVVQVVATRERAEAETIARRLTAKGYSAFVTTPANGPTLFRVRVGTFADRRQADSAAARLKREEQFKPWVTR